MWWLRSRMKIQERLYISGSLFTFVTLTLVSMFVSENVWPQTSRDQTPAVMFAVCRPRFFFELSGFRYLCSLEAKSAENLIFFPFLWCCANVGVVSRERREPPTYLSSKNKKLRDRIDSRVQLVWWLQVMGSCYNQSVWNAGNQSFSHSFCLKWRTSNFCVIHDDGEHVDFFSRKPKSI